MILENENMYNRLCIRIQIFNWTLQYSADSYYSWFLPMDISIFSSYGTYLLNWKNELQKISQRENSNRKGTTFISLLQLIKLNNIFQVRFRTIFFNIVVINFGILIRFFQRRLRFSNSGCVSFKCWKPKLKDFKLKVYCKIFCLLMQQLLLRSLTNENCLLTK